MKTTRQSRAGLRAALVALVGFALQAASPALTVTNNLDNAPSAALISGSLRWAIAGTPANGLVNFSSSMKGKTIVLKAGQLVVDKSLTIRGLGCNALTVSGNNVSRVFYVGATGVNPAIISDMTITKGNAVGLVDDGGEPDRQKYGAGIHSVGNLQILRCCITSNKAPLGNGGGVYNRGTLSALTESTVSYNTSGQHGGGIFDDQDMTIFRSAIYNNIANGDGGGLNEAGTANIINSTIACNRATGSGGGIGGTALTLNTYNVTIAGNSAAVGGGVARQGPGGSWALANTIIANNSAPTDADVNNEFGFTISAANGRNLIQNTNGGTLNTSTGLDASDITGVDPKLGPLQNNGGPTLTMALLPGSPAIDKGANSNLLSSMVSDQRVFMSRILNGGISLTVDIGAYEYATARALKFEAINDLTPCLSSTDCNTRTRARSAIRSIQCSLANRLWVNDTKLTCSGELVFEFEEDAAYAIQKIIKYSPDLACVAAATNAVQDLLLADEQLARAAITDAIACHGNASYITKANCELTAAQSSAAKADYKGAIEHYEHAWEYALKACNLCRDDDDCRRAREDCEREDRDRWGDDDRCHDGDDDDHDDHDD